MKCHIWFYICYINEMSHLVLYLLYQWNVTFGFISVISMKCHIWFYICYINEMSHLVLYLLYHRWNVTFDFISAISMDSSVSLCSSSLPSLNPLISPSFLVLNPQLEEIRHPLFVRVVHREILRQYLLLTAFAIAQVFFEGNTEVLCAGIAHHAMVGDEFCFTAKEG